MLPHCHVVGAIKTVQLEQEVVDTLKQKLTVDVIVTLHFVRAVVGGVRYYSQGYTRTTKRNSYTVCYSDGGITRYGLIKYFLSLPNQSVALLTRLSPTSHTCYPQGLGILRSRIVPVKLESSIDAVPVTSLLCKCVYCCFGSMERYIVVPPNSMTDD